MCSFDSHDQCRSTSRWTNDSPEYRWLSSKMLGLMEMTSFGTTYVYQGKPTRMPASPPFGLALLKRIVHIGQEIGQINLPDEYPEEEYKDVQTINRITGYVKSLVTDGSRMW
jgi:oligo-1,6-glucosidase